MLIDIDNLYVQGLISPEEHLRIFHAHHALKRDCKLGIASIEKAQISWELVMGVTHEGNVRDYRMKCDSMEDASKRHNSVEAEINRAGCDGILLVSFGEASVRPQDVVFLMVVGS
jgi:hypothetical protein